jgi:GH24 family phage-related lysozyme (muramidase)
MKPIPSEKGLAYTRLNENERPQTYDDATGDTILANNHTRAGEPLVGNLTIGIGHTEPGLEPGTIWPKSKIEEQYYDDYERAFHAAYMLCLIPTKSEYNDAAWSAAGEARQCVIIDMCFQMGGEGAAKFKRFFAAFKAGDWHTAAEQLQWTNESKTTHTRYFMQAPTRVSHNVAMILSGAFL